MNYTPGPWGYENSKVNGIEIAPLDGAGRCDWHREVAALAGGGGELGGPEDIANAQLICAAPDLLIAGHAAEVQLRVIGGTNDTVNCAVLKVLQDAIKKAYGK